MEQRTSPRERAAGHRVLPDTADFILEAWAPAREECLAQAVRALVDCFADVSEATPTRTIGFELSPESDDAALTAVLDEALSVFEIFGVVPVGTHLDRTEDGVLAGSFETAPVADVRLLARAPAGVRLHTLEFGRTDGSWRALVSVRL